MEKQQEQRIYAFPQDEDRPVRASRQKTGKKHDWFTFAARSIGMFLLVFGLWAGVYVMLEALQLYRDPVKIEQFALAVEKGSNLDRTLAPYEKQDVTVGAAKEDNDLHLSYFVAWMFALLLLMLTSMIAFSAMRTGGELVLQDRQGEQLIKSLTKEISERIGKNDGA